MKRTSTLLVLLLIGALIGLSTPASASALSADKAVYPTDGKLRLIPVAATTTIYKGAMVSLKTDGYATPAADTADYRFVGIAIHQVDNSSGADGDLSVTVLTAGEFTAVYASAAQTQVGELCYTADDATVAAVGTTTNDVLAGIVVKYVAANTVRVKFAVNLDAAAADVAAHVADAADAHAGTAITNTPAGAIAATTAQAAIDELDTDLTAHLDDTTDAHAGTAVTNTPAGTIAATTAQAAIDELDTDITTNLYAPFVWSIPVALVDISGAMDVVTEWVAPFDGEITSVDWTQSTVVSTASKAATLNVEIETTDVSGGEITLTSAACTPLGKYIAGAAVSGDNTFSSGEKISVEATSVTAFAEGTGFIVISMKAHIQ